MASQWFEWRGKVTTSLEFIEKALVNCDRQFDDINSNLAKIDRDLTAQKTKMTMIGVIASIVVTAIIEVGTHFLK